MGDRDVRADGGSGSRFRFEIAGVSPRTLPIRSLARYLELLSAALGDPEGLALVSIGGGDERQESRIREDPAAGRRTDSQDGDGADLCFRIAGASPRTLPVRSLARYLELVSAVLGDPEGLALVSIGEGSLSLGLATLDDGATGGRDRSGGELPVGTASPISARALPDLERQLASDRFVSAELCASGGRRLLRVSSGEGVAKIGPIRQPGFVQGVPIVVGGQGEIVPVHLRSSGRIHRCEAERDLARRIAAHLFDTPVRVHGEGSWLRNSRGKWEMSSFRIRSFEELDDTPLDVVTARLQSIDAEWKHSPDPLGDLMRFRTGED